MIQVIRAGRNPTMKHLNRVHRICVASLHERLGGGSPKDPVQLVYTPSAQMRADLYTKHMTQKDKFQLCLTQVGIDAGQQFVDHVGAVIAKDKGTKQKVGVSACYVEDDESVHACLVSPSSSELAALRPCPGAPFGFVLPAVESEFDVEDIMPYPPTPPAPSAKRGESTAESSETSSAAEASEPGA